MKLPLALAWIRSLRVRTTGSALPPSGILVLWHSDMLPCLRAFSGTGMRVLISQSRDGELGARAAGALGYRVLRGSNSRGGVAALKRIERELREDGGWIALVADGPRGPHETCKPGAVWLARRTGLPVICAAAHVPLGITLGGWAKVKAPLPFTGMDLRLSAPLYPETTAEIEMEMRELRVGS